MPSEKELKKIREDLLENSSHMHAMHDIFQSIAESKLQSSIAIENTNLLSGNGITVSSNDNISLLLKNMKKSKKAYHGYIEAIVFSALSLEAFINYYIIHITSEETFKKSYDDRSVKDKWLNVPRELKNIVFDEESSEVKNFKNTIDARNKLVHFKARTIKGTKYVRLNTLYKSQAINAVKAVKEMRKMINKYDPPLTGLLSGLEIWERVED